MPSPPPQYHSSSSQESSGEAPRYCEHPTPYPSKLADQKSYFPEDDDGKEKPADPPAPRAARRPTMRRRVSSASDRYTRMGGSSCQSDVEEDGGEPGASRRARRGDGGPSVVAQIVQFGLRHGLGRGLGSGFGLGGRRLPRAASAASLYVSDRERSGWDKGKRVAAADQKPGYREKCQMAREGRFGQIVHHVEGASRVRAGCCRPAPIRVTVRADDG